MATVIDRAAKEPKKKKDSCYHTPQFQEKFPMMPNTVYMRDKSSGSLKIIAEYGQDYGNENPERVLYHGYGHSDTPPSVTVGPRKDEEMVCMPFSQYGMYFLVFRFLFGTRNYLIP
ncbi:hypothetical protein Peur_018765 [Populus x canadensis]